MCDMNVLYVCWEVCACMCFSRGETIALPARVRSYQHLCFKCLELGEPVKIELA